MAINSNFGPAGACDHCFRFAVSLDQVGVCGGAPGILCSFCKVGHFRHRQEWIFSRCLDCKGIGITALGMCGTCHMQGVVAVRRPEYASPSA